VSSSVYAHIRRNPRFTELVAKRTEKSLLLRATESHEGEASEGNTHLRGLRGADDAPHELPI